VQGFLAGLLDTRCRSRDRRCEFVPAGREVRLLRRFPDLSDDVAELRIGGGEGQAAFDLDLQRGRGAVPTDRFDDHVIERVPRDPLLKGDASGGCPGEAARFAA
jgi:hypothetical protein